MRPRRLPDGLLADVLGRLSIALAAGIDIRRAVAAEADRVPARWRDLFQQVVAGVAAGEPLAVALGRAGDAVPPVVLGMIAVGDRTGRDAETLAAVAASLVEAVAARRALVAALVPAAVRLAAAVAVIGLVILLSGTLHDLDDKPLDILGLGLRGQRGLAVYLGTLTAVGVTLVLALATKLVVLCLLFLVALAALGGSCYLLVQFKQRSTIGRAAPMQHVVVTPVTPVEEQARPVDNVILLRRNVG